MHNVQAKAESKTMSNTRAKSRWVAKTAILAALATVLMYLEFPIPLMPPFLKFDFADLPALLGGFAMGPGTGVLIQLLRNILHLPATNTMGVGELANFIVGGTLVFISGTYYKKHKTKKGALTSLILGGLAMTVIAVFVNYFLNIPFFINVMNLSMEMIVGAANAVGNTLVKDMKTLLAFVFVPFNLFKTLVVTVLTMLIYKPVSPMLHK